MRSLARASPKAARARPARPAPRRGPSKLHAAKGAGLSRRLGIAAAALVAVLGAVVVLATGDRGGQLVGAARGAVDSQFGSLGFRLGTVHLQGASRAAQGEVLKAADVKLGTPIFAVDLARLRGRVEQVGWVAHARVIRLLPDTLVIAVAERPLMAVWQHAGHTLVVASNGAVVSAVDPGHFTGLPLIVGDGANLAARAILPTVLARPRLAGHLAALVRVDGRRWDLRLKDGGVVLLPADGEGAALNRLDSLDRSSRILQLGLARIDLRDPGMVVVRPRGVAAPAVVKVGV